MSTDDDRSGIEGDEIAATQQPDEATASDSTTPEGDDVRAPSSAEAGLEASGAGDDDRTPDERERVEADSEVETSDDDIRDLLRGALGNNEPDIPDVLKGVQRKLRQRSRGKFYADGWSTARQPPINTYLITSLVMLAILFFVWAVLSPLSGEPASVDPPAPINVVPGDRIR